MEEGRYTPPEAVEMSLSLPTELVSEQDLAQFWLTFRRNNDIAVSDTAREERSASIQAKQTKRELEKNKSIHFFGIKAGEKMVATGKLETYEDDEGIKRAYLSLLTVDPEYRGKNVAKDITDARVETAQKLGCEYVHAHVFTGNPIALTTKLKEGYFVKELEIDKESPDSGGFIVSKRINGEIEHDKKDGPLGELKEVELSDLSTIKSLLDDGWIGIDAKNLGDSKDKDPKQWKLIMEQAKK